MSISKNPVNPNCLKFTAQGYINITSTSNNTNKIAIKKYLIENGNLTLPSDSIPHSNISDFIFDFFFVQ